MGDDDYLGRKEAVVDWNDTTEQSRFRSEVRTVIAEKMPAYYLKGGRNETEGGWIADRKAEDQERRQAAKDWADALAEHGWLAPQWPKEYGGAGLSLIEQFILNQELASAGAPVVAGPTVTQLGSSLVLHGTEEQKEAYLPRILSGEMVWAQGYSEPGAGSDLASLQTRAVLDGDEYILNGQKIWTSGAHHAEALYVLVRTDPDAPKHRGITFLLIDDIKAPGINVRPLINMADEHGFNETFFEDVRVPTKNVLGDVNRGWYVSATLLDFERSNIRGAIDLRRKILRLIDYLGSPDAADKSRVPSGLRGELADRYIETEIGSNFSLRIISIQHRGIIPNYEASTAKLFISESLQRLQRTGMKAFGLYGNIWDAADSRAPLGATYTRGYVTSVPATIAAGSSEIQRNIIATRGLGLPRG